MASISEFLGSFLGQRRRVAPTEEAGTSGTAVYGGYVENIEKDIRLAGQNRYRTAADILANVSIVAAGLRYYLNLVAVPGWTYEPAQDLGEGESSDAAKKAAEFMTEVMEGLDTSWARIVRRSGMYRFHGFGVQEWIARRRDDGMIGLLDIEPRPSHTIEQWDVDEKGQVLGVGQRSPQTSELLYIPRSKFLYLVDDTLTDSPEGMGLFRHLVEPAERLKAYLKLEAMGYERDLRGLPVGRAPLSELNDMVKRGDLKPEDHVKMLKGIRNFLKTGVKKQDTSLLLDSSAYQGTTADGTTVSGTPKWGLDLLSSDATGFADLGKAIDRLTHDMARILGAESLLLGGGPSGSRALSEDKSRNLYLSVNGCVSDIREGVQRDIVKMVWSLNGLDPAIMPKAKTEDVAFKDAAQIAATLRDMATAGAVLAPDDPAIDDVRDLLGISRQPEDAVARALEMQDLGRQAQEKVISEPTPKPGDPKEEKA